MAKDENDRRVSDEQGPANIPTASLPQDPSTLRLMLEALHRSITAIEEVRSECLGPASAGCAIAFSELASLAEAMQQELVGVVGAEGRSKRTSLKQASEWSTPGMVIVSHCLDKQKLGDCLQAVSTACAEWHPEPRPQGRLPRAPILLGTPEEIATRERELRREQRRIEIPRRRRESAMIRRVRKATEGLLSVLRECRDRLATLLIQVDSPLSAGSPPTVGKDARSSEQPWYHDHSESRPREYQHGPLEGQKKELAVAYYGDGVDPRSLETAGQTGAIWICKLGRRRYEAWFKDKGRLDVSRRRLNELQGETEK